MRTSRDSTASGSAGAHGRIEGLVSIPGALLLALLGSVACGGPADLSAASSAVAAADSAWEASFSSKEGLDAIVSYLSDDAVLVPPGRPPVRGKRAIRRYLAAGLSTPGFSVSWETTDVRVDPSGEVAYLTQRSRIAAEDSTGRLVTFRGRGVTIWERGDEGRWRCVLYVWNQAERTEHRRVELQPA